MEFVCDTCLSRGRLLFSIGPYRNLFQSLLCDIYEDSYWNTKVICWECRSLLDKALKFIRRAKLADAILSNTAANNKLKQKQILSSLIKYHKSGYDYEIAHQECTSLNVDFKIEFPDELESALIGEGEQFDVLEDKYSEESDFLDNAVPKVDKQNGDRTENSDSIGGTNRIDDSITEDVDLVTPVIPTDKIRESTTSIVCSAEGTWLRKDINSAQRTVESRQTRARRGFKKLTPQEAKERYDVVSLSHAEMLERREKDKVKSFYVRAPFKCVTCFNGFYNKNKYDEHVRQRHLESAGDMMCQICQSRFKTAKGLRCHCTERHFGLYVCRKCPHRHRSKLEILRHYEIEHDFDRTFPCRECDEIFSFYRQLKYHREVKHKNTTCPQCGKTVSTRTSLKKHMKLHENDDPAFECTTCNKKFRAEETYRQHRRIHLPQADSDAYCIECDKQFKNKYIYRSHLRLSSKHATAESLKFSCSECSKRFITQGHLNRHYNFVHLKETKYQCEKCARCFASRSRMHSHVKLVHNKVRVDKKEVCHICNKKFMAKQTLKSHIRTHTGERPHKCNLCDATFTQNGSLWTHNKLVHLKLKKKDKIYAKSNQPAVS